MLGSILPLLRHVLVWFVGLLLLAIFALLIATLALLVVPESKLVELIASALGANPEKLPRSTGLTATFKLLAALALDTLANVGYGVPVVGDLLDFILAPFIGCL